MVSQTQLSFGDIFLNACDCYVDVISCKNYTSKLFDPPDQGDRQDFDYRDANIDTCDSRCDESERSERMMQTFHSASPLSLLLSPLLPLSYIMEPQTSPYEMKRESAYSGSPIFRARDSDDEIRISPRKRRDSEYSEFCKLCRCSAWSQDTLELGEALPRPSESIREDDLQARLIHWDEIVTEPLEFRSSSIKESIWSEGVGHGTKSI